MGFIRLFGVSEWTARLPGVFLGALTLVLLFHLARRLAGRRAALYAVFLLALSPFFIEFSREARPYVASAFLATASWLFYLRLLRSGRRADAFHYTLATALLLLTFYPGVIVPAAQALMLTASRAAWRKWRLFLCSWLAAAAIFLAAWGPVLWAQLRGNGGSGAGGRFWLEAYYPHGIAARDVLAALADLFFGAASLIPSTLRATLVILLALAFPVLLFLRPATGQCLIRNPQSGLLPGPQLRNRLALPFVFWSCWGSTAIFILICLVKPLLVSRYLTLLSPFAALYLAFLLTRLPLRVGAALLAVILILGASGYTDYLRSMPRSDWRGAALILQSRMKPQDVVVTESITARSCLNYYFKLLGRPGLANNACSFDEFMQRTGGGRYPFPDRTLWFVASYPERQARQLALLNSRNRLESQTPLAAGFILLRFTGQAAVAVHL